MLQRDKHMKIELEFSSLEDEHVICFDEMDKKHEIPEFMFDGVPKLFKIGMTIICNLTKEEIESYDIFI